MIKAIDKQKIQAPNKKKLKTDTKCLYAGILCTILHAEYESDPISN